MNLYKSELHIHSVLSPCGGLEMSPSKIVERANAVGLKIIAITDHNCTLHGPLTRKLAEQIGIMVVFGAEVTTKEDIHCLCLFGDEKQRIDFQNFIDSNLPEIMNNPKLFGYQLVVNKDEEIVDEVKNLLISGLDVGINDLAEHVHLLGGLFIPAHIDRPKYSIMSQLGFVPKDLKFDALEISKKTSIEQFVVNTPGLKNARFIKSSDSHDLDQIGITNTFMKMESLCWSEFRMAILGIDGREIICS